MLEAQHTPPPVHHTQSMPARRPSCTGDDHNNLFNSLNATPSSAPNRYRLGTGLSASYVPEWKGEVQL